MITLKLTKSPIGKGYEDQLGFIYTEEEVNDLIVSGNALVVDFMPKEIDKYHFDAVEEAFFETL